MQIMFPDALALITEYGKGLLHCEVAALREYFEAVLTKKNISECERIMRYVKDLLPLADASLENAFLVSFLEDLALGNLSDEDKRIIIEIAPDDILHLLRQHIAI